MTTLTILMRPEAASISQDRAFYDHGDGLPDMSVLAKDYRHESRHVSDATKIKVHNGVIIGSMGGFGYWMAWHDFIDRAHKEIDGLAAMAPDALRYIYRHVQDSTREFITVMCGWSVSEHRVIGYSFSFDSDFTPQRLPDGLTHAPPMNADAPDYARLHAIWCDALEGRDVPALHRALHEHYKWQCAQGLLRAGVLLSDDYDLASVDSQGARLQGAAVAIP